jgi:hypothetical protein
MPAGLRRASLDAFSPFLLALLVAAALLLPAGAEDGAPGAAQGGGAQASTPADTVARLGAARAAWLRARTLNASSAPPAPQPGPGGRRRLRGLAAPGGQPRRRLAASPDPCPFTTAADLSALSGGPAWVGH